MTVDELTKLSVEAFLDRSAARTPTPGGGSITSLAGALAGALARMVAAYSISKKTPAADKAQVEQVAIRLERSDQLLRALISLDAEAYSTMTAARKVAGDDPTKQQAYQDAVLAALAVPMETAALASSALREMCELKPLANRYLLSDLAIAAVLARAAAEAARYTVWVNIGELTDKTRRDGVLKDIDKVVAHCVTLCSDVEGFVRDQLEHTG